MKKILILMLCALLLSCTACGGGNSAEPSDEDEIVVTTEEPQGEAETEESEPPTTASDSQYPFAEPIIPAELSADPQSFQVSLDGNVITLPAPVSEFAALGWECDYDIDNETLKPGFIMVGNASLRKGNASLSGVSFINLDEKELPVSECYVYGFAFAYDTKGAAETSIVLPGGLHIGSTLDEITAAYGEPTETDDSRSSVTKLIYDFGDGNEITFEIDKNQPPYWNRMTIYRETSSEN